VRASDVARRIAERLDEAKIPYAIGGALALGAWGAPRMTNDVDISIFARLEDFGLVADTLERAGLMLDRVGAPKDLTRIGFFKAHSGRMAVDVFMSDHPLMKDLERNRRRVEVAGAHLWFISPADLCVVKLLYGRPKDVVDLERLVVVRPEIDLQYVRSWVTRILPAGDDRIGVTDDLIRRFRP